MNAVDEAICRWHVLLLECFENRLRDLETSIAFRQRTMGWQIVESECDLLRVCDGRKRKRGEKNCGAEMQGSSYRENQRLRRPSKLRKKLAKQTSVPSMRQSMAG